MKMQEKISHSKTESIIYKLVRNKSLSDEEKEIIDKIVENKDYGIKKFKDDSIKI